MSRKTFNDIQPQMDAMSVSEKRSVSRAKNYYARVCNSRPVEDIQLDEFFEFFSNEKWMLFANGRAYIGKKTIEAVEKLKNIFVTEVKKSMTEQEYNLAEGVRRSDLWRMEESAEKYKYFLDHPIEPTEMMIFGAAAHKYVLEQDEWHDEYAIAPVIDKRTKEGKAVWEEFKAENEGKTIISEDNYQTMSDMAEQLRKSTLISTLLYEDGDTETPFFWNDPETGELCKVKLDRLIKGIDGRYYVVDYKTTVSAQTDKFNHSIWTYGYHLQAAMYTEAVMNCLGLDYRPGFIFVAQEKKAPYSTNVIQVTEEVMNAGINKYHELLGKLHECKELDIWPGFNGIDDTMNETTLPGWYVVEEE